MALFHARGNPVCRKEDCSPYDIGTVYKEIARFSNEKFRFIQNVWKHDRIFNFPSPLESGDRHQKFKPDWLVRFPWLLYSKYLDGAFCLPCVCFGMESGKNGAKLNTVSCFDLRSHSGRLLALSFNSIRVGSRKYMAQLSLPCRNSRK